MCRPPTTLSTSASEVTPAQDTYRDQKHDLDRKFNQSRIKALSSGEPAPIHPLFPEESSRGHGLTLSATSFIKLSYARNHTCCVGFKPDAGHSCQIAPRVPETCETIAAFFLSIIFRTEALPAVHFQLTPKLRNTGDETVRSLGQRPIDGPVRGPNDNLESLFFMAWRRPVPSSGFEGADCRKRPCMSC